MHGGAKKLTERMLLLPTVPYSMNLFGEDLDSRGQSRSTDADFSNSVEAANEIFTAYLCTSGDYSIMEKEGGRSGPAKSS